MQSRLALFLIICFFIAVTAAGAATEGGVVPSPQPGYQMGEGAIAADAAGGARELPPKFKFEIKSFYKNPLKGPKSVFVDREHGEIYVTDPARGETLVFDAEGAPVFSFGGRPAEFAPLDVAVKGGRIYLTFENKPYIGVFSLRGEPVKTISPKEGKFVPGRMDMDEEGNIYVINTAEDKCLVLDKDDNFIGSIGEGLKSLAGVAAGGGRVYLITPFFKGRVIHVYTAKGEHLMSFQAIEDRGGTLGLPVSGKADKDGNFWLVDALRGVIIFNKEGKEISRFGGAAGAEREMLNFPFDIDFDGEGMVYIVEEGAKRISVFK